MKLRNVKCKGYSSKKAVEHSKRNIRAAYLGNVTCRDSLFLVET